MALQQFGPRRHDEEERGLEVPGEQVLDEREHPLAGPVQVLQDQHGRAGVGDQLEEARPGGEVLLAGGLRRLEGEQRAQALAQPPSLIALGQHRVELRFDGHDIVGVEDAGVILEDLAQGPERDPLAVRHAASLSPGDHLWSHVEGAGELEQQATLADPGLADNEDDAAFLCS